jgi:mannose/fructose/N-acetylgalactosamine-specific phosphotransferase system component IIC
MNYDYKGIALIPIITILVDVIKKAGLPSNFAPLMSIILGVIFGLIFESSGDVKTAIITGIIMGMSASGLYSGGREASRGITKIRNK